MSDFKKGDRIKLTNNDAVTIEEKIGEGGQGAVYKVQYGSKEYALKWYIPHYIKHLKPSYKNFYRNLCYNVSTGTPSPAFLWPKAVAFTDKRNSEGFGYIMELRPTEYEEFTKFIKARVFFSGTQAVINAAINVVEAFQALHRKGLSYQDLSPGNFFVNKDTGDVLICDNDNVAPDGENLGVGGTPGYMAPEIILHIAKPSTNTDLFSLSVILFDLFFLSHPLEGANSCRYPCLTPEVEKKLYAESPVFIMSDKDKSNAPVRGVCSNLIKLWPVFPEFLHDAFQQAFGDGLKNGRSRLSESDWKKVLYRLRDDAVTCPVCHEINFADMASNGALECTVCHLKYPVPFKASVNGFKIVAGSGKTISEYHLSHGSDKIRIGSFVESKKNPGVFGLKNESQLFWSVEYPGKDAMTYEPGKVVTVIPETQIHIGNQTIQIEK